MAKRLLDSYPVGTSKYAMAITNIIKNLYIMIVNKCLEQVGLV